MDTNKIIRILNYEILMLQNTYSVLRELKKNTIEYNVYMESFLNHASCIYDFFYEKRKQDDIIVKDLPFNKVIFEQRSTPKSEFEDIRFKHKRNKQLAHITESRIKLEASGEKSWQYGKIYKMLDKTIRALVDSLPEKEKKLFSASVK
jgi:hypothetical protein